jgi:hypothetical protein
VLIKEEKNVSDSENLCEGDIGEMSEEGKV